MPNVHPSESTQVALPSSRRRSACGRSAKMGHVHEPGRGARPGAGLREPQPERVSSDAGRDSVSDDPFHSPSGRDARGRRRSVRGPSSPAPCTRCGCRPAHRFPRRSRRRPPTIRRPLESPGARRSPVASSCAPTWIRASPLSSGRARLEVHAHNACGLAMLGSETSFRIEALPLNGGAARRAGVRFAPDRARAKRKRLGEHAVEIDCPG
jgi:hypothetical protein